MSNSNNSISNMSQLTATELELIDNIMNTRIHRLHNMPINLYNTTPFSHLDISPHFTLIIKDDSRVSVADFIVTADSSDDNLWTVDCIYSRYNDIITDKEDLISNINVYQNEQIVNMSCIDAAYVYLHRAHNKHVPLTKNFYDLYDNIYVNMNFYEAVCYPNIITVEEAYKKRVSDLCIDDKYVELSLDRYKSTLLFDQV